MVETHELVHQLESLLAGFRKDLLGAQGDLSQLLRTTSDHMASLCQMFDAPPVKLPAGTESNELQELLAERERSLMVANQHVTELERTVSDLKTEISQLRSQEAWIIAANQDLSERLVALRNEEKSSLTSLAACTEEIEQLRASLQQIASNNQHNDDLGVEIEDIRRANAALRSALETAEAQITALEKQQRIIISALSGDCAARKLGEILVAAEIITQSQLEDALLEQKRRTQSLLGEILVEKGRAREEDVAQSVACQLQLPLIHLHNQSLDRDTAKTIGRHMCVTYGCVPLQGGGKRIVLAMENPKDTAVMTTIKKTLGREVAPVVAVPSQVRSAIEDIFCA